MRKPAVREEASSTQVLCSGRTRELLLGVVLVCGLCCATECGAEERGALPSFEPRDARPTRDSALRFDLPSPTARLTGTSMARPDIGQGYAPAADSLPSLFDIGSLTVPETHEPPAQFSPRKYFAPDQPLEPLTGRPPSLRTTTVWQRLKDYRSKDRVRLVTLFETAGSSVSLQAGRHGEPSLQWTSRSLNRGGSTRGLLDHLVAASLGAAGIAFTQPGNNGYAANAIAVPSAAIRPIRPVIAAATSHAP